VAPLVLTLVSFTDAQTPIPSLVGVLTVGAAAAIGGRWIGLVAAGAAVLAFDYHFVAPKDRFGTVGGEDIAAAILFSLTAIAVSGLIARERRARAAEEEARAVAADAREYTERLQRVADALSEAVTPQQVLDAVLREGVSAADARAGLIAVVTEDGASLEVIAQNGYDEQYVGAEGRWRRFAIDADLPLSEVARTGTPLFFESRADRNARFPLLREVSEDSHALACLPLVVESQVIGGLVFSFGADRTFDARRRALKLAIARQAAQSLERARAYDVAELARSRTAFLAEATTLLASSLEYEETLARLARLAVPRLADWCSIDMLGDGGKIERLAVAHADPAKVAWAEELQRRFPPNPEARRGIPAVLRSGEPEYLPELPRELLERAGAGDPELEKAIEQLGFRSWICVPLNARGRTIGSLSLVGAESGRTFTPDDLELATQLAERAAVAVDNARLYRESERRADAARALASIGDGVVLLDPAGRVRAWNPAIEVLTGVAEGDALGRLVDDVLPAWETVREHVVLAGSADGSRSSTLPLAVPHGERWASVTAVEFAEGSVYTLRDVSEEHALERARSEFVATASHELRTPIAAVYGSVRTLRREDIELSESDRELFLQIIEAEGERLVRIVDQILVAGQIDAGEIGVAADACDVRALVESVLASARARAPESVRLELSAPDALPLVACDGDRLRQVLVNLVENAVKYSPDGGLIDVTLTSHGATASIAVRDRGLGIPPAEQERIFEKFYRLDPSMTRGVGGSGLGLYISRELVARMHGRLTVESEPGSGSTFTVELPTA
jgi:signal transduction histidine kinase